MRETKLTEADTYEPEFAWAVAWSNGSPRPFIMARYTGTTRKAAILSFLEHWQRDKPDLPMLAWRRAYRDGARCIRVSVSPWGYKSPALPNPEVE